MIKIDYERYGVPRVIHNGQSRLRLRKGKAVVNTLRVNSTKQLDFYSHLNKTDTLIVSFHGAYNRQNPGSYPLFWRVSSLGDRTGAFLAFTDPTRLLGGDHDILISWFLGKAGWDPQAVILNVVERAMQTCGATKVMFVGGSGGGFAALRASAAVPGSCAFVQDATVGLEEHNPVIVRSYFKKAWPGWDQETLMSGFPELFSMPLHYRRRIPKNFVFMTQSRLDSGHIKAHFERFANAHGIPPEGGTSRRGGRVLKIYDPAVPGHGKITAKEFDDFYQECTTAWNSWLKSDSSTDSSKISFTDNIRNLLSSVRSVFSSLSISHKFPFVGIR